MITRFAPSPTGPMHLGHAYSALLACDLARNAGGRFLLRIEDIDVARSRSEYETLIYDDIAWLGIDWERPVMRQSERSEAYDKALRNLWDQGLLYPCICTRRDIAEALSAPHGSPSGPDGPVYPGTCRNRDRVALKGPHALRLDIRKAAQVVETLTYTETGAKGPGKVTMDPQRLIEDIGDVVLARRDIGTSYHLAVVVDDADQAITTIVRGRDLAPATPIHVLLQKLLGLPTPIYHHHRLIRDQADKRLAKRNDVAAIRTYRDAGQTPADIRAMVGF